MVLRDETNRNVCLIETKVNATTEAYSCWELSYWIFQSSCMCMIHSGGSLNILIYCQVPIAHTAETLNLGCFYIYIYLGSFGSSVKGASTQIRKESLSP